MLWKCIAAIFKNPKKKLREKEGMSSLEQMDTKTFSTLKHFLGISHQDETPTTEI